MTCFREFTENWRIQLPIQKPEYRDPKQYDYIDELSDIELAWECLRRNSEYIEGFREWSSLMQHHSAAFHSINSRSKNTTDIEAFTQKAINTKTEADVLCDKLCERFRLSKNIGLLNPYVSALEQPGYIAFLGTVFEVDDLPKPALLRLWVAGEEVPGFKAPLNSDLCMDVRIVAERSIEDQLDSIKKFYEFMHRRGHRSIQNAKQKTVRKRPQIKEYLRIFDARSAGLGNKEIAKVFYKELESNDPNYAQNQVSRYYSRAKKWVNFGYLKLIPNDLNV